MGYYIDVSSDEDSTLVEQREHQQQPTELYKRCSHKQTVNRGPCRVQQPYVRECVW